MKPGEWISDNRYNNDGTPRYAQKIPDKVREIMNKTPTKDVVNHPHHYTSHPSGVECIQITEHMGFNLGNAIKYIWRADLKNDAIEDMKKAIFYLNREIEKRVRTDTK